jgi:hypothetical protein
VNGSLLAVDVGLRYGLALYGPDGRLAWYRSQHLGNRTRLRRAVHGLLASLPGLAWLALEGGGSIADVWLREAERRGLGVLQVGAETWRHELLLPREQRSGADAKANADRVARAVIAWSGAKAPTSLRHDAAEAILVGLWACTKVGLLEGVPAGLRPC